MSNNQRKVTITGTIYRIGEAKQVSDNFTVKPIVLQVIETYGSPPKQKKHLIEFQFANSRISEINPYTEGEEVTIEAELTGREWNDKIFLQLSGWACKPRERQNISDLPAQTPSAPTESSPRQAYTPADDDLPF
jgi:hypothetical protein